MCLSLQTSALSFVRSTQILTSPLDFGTATIGAHQGVGSVTGIITPKDCSLSNSAFTFLCNGNEMRRGE